jgi:hypothetical protein
MERAGVSWGAGAREGVAVGIAGAGLGDLGIGVVAAEAFGAEPVGMIEDGVASVGGEVAATGEDIVHATVGAVGSVDGGVAGEIVEIEDGAGGGGGAAFIEKGGSGFLDALAERIVRVDGGGTGVHLSDATFGVIRVVVDPVVEEVSGGVIGVAVDAIVVLRIGGIVAGEGGDEGIGAVLLPAIAETVVDV